ncbi:hypothetical protein SCALIN_C38_0033 [Candidatus Scalindua japonica]|uniref:Uncharacterized protein n=1 Tax=Candidatus Scalindua japonica TaxID=1284222 RepID=A0A286U3F8_9BACT|nr:hypothetical protein [Candidatus Scalindua japonica]GAX62670.1 hypothetical protein SCALIN_C38_0033 [Candidatus Scalindua japonica]
MIKDCIVESIRDIREAHAKKFDFDLDKIYKDIKESEKTNPNKIIALKPKLLKHTHITKKSS